MHSLTLYLSGSTGPNIRLLQAFPQLLFLQPQQLATSLGFSITYICLAQPTGSGTTPVAPQHSPSRRSPRATAPLLDTFSSCWMTSRNLIPVSPTQQEMATLLSAAICQLLPTCWCTEFGGTYIISLNSHRFRHYKRYIHTIFCKREGVWVVQPLLHT